MANATETMKVHIEVSGWVFALGHLEEWRQEHPGATLDDYLSEVQAQTDRAKERLIEVEVENGATREAAERLARQMH
ncbi:hypothetical protein [Streptomyces sp. NPDC094149]|uniref:hypothetical protein n=1 Tax=Streptomyces sp. NPDC094149 TaxID=3155079 RepID=UPI0033290518